MALMLCRSQLRIAFVTISMLLAGFVLGAPTHTPRTSAPQLAKKTASPDNSAPTRIIVTCPNKKGPQGPSCWLDSPSSGAYLVLTANKSITFTEVPEANVFVGDGKDRVIAVNMSHHDISELKDEDASTFRLFAANLRSIDLASNKIKRIMPGAFEGFKPQHTVSVNLTGNNRLRCHDVCPLLSLKMMRFKGMCSTQSGNVVNFTLPTFKMRHCQSKSTATPRTTASGDIEATDDDMETEGTDSDGSDYGDSTPTPTGKTSGNNQERASSSDSTTYIGIGVGVGVLAIVITVTVVVVVVVRRSRLKPNSGNKGDSSTRKSKVSSASNTNLMYEHANISGMPDNSERENVLYEPADRRCMETRSTENPLYGSGGWQLQADFR